MKSSTNTILTTLRRQLIEINAEQISSFANTFIGADYTKNESMVLAEVFLDRACLASAVTQTPSKKASYLASDEGEDKSIVDLTQKSSSVELQPPHKNIKTQSEEGIDENDPDGSPKRVAKMW